MRARTILTGGCMGKSLGESSFSGNKQKPAKRWGVTLVWPHGTRLDDLL